MKYYDGLDVSVKETAICIVDETGKICRELKLTSHPDDLVSILDNPAYKLVRIRLEAGPLSQWLFSGLAEAGLPAVCIETRHTKAFLKAQVNKTDRNDARGIAQMMRVNLFRPVHVKTLTTQKRRALLTARKLLQEKAIAIENDIRGMLRNFGLKVGGIGTIGFEARIRELIDGTPDLGEVISPLLAAREKLRAEFAKLHRKVLNLVHDDNTCRRRILSSAVCKQYHSSQWKTCNFYHQLEAQHLNPSPLDGGASRICHLNNEALSTVAAMMPNMLPHRYLRKNYLH